VDSTTIDVLGARCTVKSAREVLFLLPPELELEPKPACVERSAVVIRGDPEIPPVANKSSCDTFVVGFFQVESKLLAAELSVFVKLVTVGAVAVCVFPIGCLAVSNVSASKLSVILRSALTLAPFCVESGDVDVNSPKILPLEVAGKSS
jgi:hypothetical protein